MSLILKQVLESLRAVVLDQGRGTHGASVQIGANQSFWIKGWDNFSSHLFGEGKMPELFVKSEWESLNLTILAFYIQRASICSRQSRIFRMRTIAGVYICSTDDKFLSELMPRRWCSFTLVNMPWEVTIYSIQRYLYALRDSRSCCQ